ncbi:MAG: TonB-dependent receptor, partial [Desulfobacteraceae bacterium]
DDVVVTGSRQEQKTEKIPAQVTVITAEDILASGAQSIPDALSHIGGVFVTDLNGNGFNKRIDMGGFGDTSDRHVAIVVNGRKINPIDQSGINFLSIPIENVEKIEVLHGGNSVLYGSDAMGGVINIITKDHAKGVQISAEAGLGNWDTNKQTASLAFGTGQMSGNMGFVRYDTDGYRDRSEADRQSLFGKLTFYATDILSLSAEGNTTRANYEYPGGLSKAALEADRRQAVNQFDEGESQDDFVVLNANADWGTAGELNVDLSYRHYQRQDDMTSWGTNYDYDYDTVGLNPQYNLDTELFGRDNRLTIGAELYDTDYKNASYSTWTASTTYFSHDQKTAGFYAQDELSVMENLILNLGARYEDFDTTLDSTLGGETEIDENEWAWNVGLAYIYSPGSKVYGRVYQAYRFPRVDEFMNLFSGAVNTDLTHETSIGYEAGVRYVGMADRLVLNVRAFLFDVEDEIAWNGILWQNENLEETRHQGAELNLKFKANDLLTMFCGVGYTDAEFTTGDNDGKQIPLVPEFKANLGAMLSFDNGFGCRVQVNHIGSRYPGSDYSNSFEELDSANTVDVYLTYKFDRVELFLNATNVFDEEYHNGYQAAWGENFYPMPEAAYYAGVRVKF